MPKFSRQSKHRLSTTDWRLQLICNRVIQFYDISVLDGRRSRERQAEYYWEGNTKVQFPNSKHNPDPTSDIPENQQLVEAVDLAPYPIVWKKKERFYYLAGCMFAVADDLGVTLRWGGDWDGNKDFGDQNFDDLVHYELKQ